MSERARRLGATAAGTDAAVPVAVGTVVLVALTFAVVVHPGPLPGEIGWVRAWQRLGPPIPAVAEIVRVTTGTEAALLAGLVPATWAIVRHGWRGAAAAGIIAGSMLIVQPTTKEIVDRPRPAASQVEVRAGSSSAGYPSGHSLSSTALWGAVAGVALIHRRRAVAAAATVPIAANLVAPAVQGVHWPSDSVAGTLIGAGAALLAVGVLMPHHRSG